MAHPFRAPVGTTWRVLQTRSVASLIAANLIPLFGVLFFGWGGGVVMVLYWCETAVIGLYSILKLPYALRWEAWIAVPFFIVHFGVFLGITGFLALAFYGFMDEPTGKGWEILRPIRLEMLLFIPAVIVSHGVSFVTHFLGDKEYKLTADTDVLMAAPYIRVGVVFASVFLGAIATYATGAPAAFMSVFIVLKIVVDTIAHLKAHAVKSPERV